MMDEMERRFDFHLLGLAIKNAREKKGWTQAYLAELVDRTDRTIMSIENKGQHPSLNTFYRIVTLLGISVDQYFYEDSGEKASPRRKRLDVMLDTMDEQELIVMESTAEGLQKARKSEVG